MMFGDVLFLTNTANGGAMIPFCKEIDIEYRTIMVFKLYIYIHTLVELLIILVLFESI